MFPPRLHFYWANESAAAGSGGLTAGTPSATGGASTSAPAGSSSPDSSAAASSSAAQAGGGGGAVQTGGNYPSTGAGGSGTAGAAPPPSSVRDILRGMGPGYSQLADQYQDDRSLVQYLTSERDRAAQLAPLAPYAQQYVQNAADFQTFLAQKKVEAEKAQQQQQKPWWNEHWNPPEYDPAWETQLTRDTAGNIIPVQGAPPDLAQKYLNYQQFRRNQADKLMQNPFQFLEPGIRTLAQQIANQAVQQHMGQYQDQVFAQQFAAQNSNWLYQANPQGQPLVDQSGMPVLSQHGQAFRGYVIEAMQMGMNDIKAQQKYALGMVQRDAALAQAQQNATDQNGNQAKQNFLTQSAAANQPNAGGSIPRADLNGNQPPQNRRLSLNERLRKNLAENGINDNVLQQQMAAPAAPAVR